MATSKFKKITGKLHLWLGLASGLVICIVALTGCILVFEEELDELFAPDIFLANTITSQKLPLDDIVGHVKTAHPDYTFRQLFTYHDAEKTILLRAEDAAKQEHLLGINPYTGYIQTNALYEQRFFTIVLHLHRYLLIDGAGKTITGISAACFLLILISGLILWFPKKIKQYKQRLVIKGGTSGKRLNWDLHVVTGFYIFPVMLAICITGLVWSFDVVEDGLYYLIDGKPKQAENIPEPPQLAHTPKTRIYTRMQQQTDSLFHKDGDLRFIFPKAKDKKPALRVYKEFTDAPIPNTRSVAYFEPITGTLLKATPYKNLTNGEKARRAIYPIHTGSIYGLPTKIIAFISSFVCCTLPVTGFFIWWNRKKKKK